MRQPILDLLDYPRRIVRQQLRDRECPHGMLFDTGDRACRLCEATDDCRWLYDNEEFAAFDRRGDRELMAALEYAVDYVMAIPAVREHDIDNCRCETCRWLQRAGELVEARPGRS